MDVLKFFKTFIYIYLITRSFTENQRQFYTRLQNYSKSINASHGDITTLNECALNCFTKFNENSSFLYQETLRLCQCFSYHLDIDIGEPTLDINQLYGFYLSGYQTFQIESVTMRAVLPKHTDCLSFYQSGFQEDGIYTIYPGDLHAGVTTWCDMTNGGWTVIQRRQDGREDFYRKWDEYVNGFGNKTGEYWLGLEAIHELTKSPTALYIEMDTFGDVSPTSAYATYSTFEVADISTNYTMTVSGYSGDCGDSLSFHSGMQFSTLDRDNDNYKRECAVEFSGAWWYDACHVSNLNGLYLSGHHSSFADGINWFTCWRLNYSLKSTVMKLKRTV